MGVTISEFVQEARMNKAKELLQDPSIKIYEGAEQIGIQLQLDEQKRGQELTQLI